MGNIVTAEAIITRNYWIEEIRKISGNFTNDYERLSKELTDEVENNVLFLIDHLRLCGNIPESYKHDSSEEKLYSKYTDCLLALFFKAIGLKSIVLTERADAADVEVFAKNYSFVADAKAFRLSRTAKNQKDFKVQAMHGWKHGKPNAMIVCPIYQLPRASSQIYANATISDVCIITYSHLSLLLAYSLIDGNKKAQELLKNTFKTVPLLPVTKNATDYWMGINKTFLGFSHHIEKLWQNEKQASFEAIEIAKLGDLEYLANSREKILRMSHEEALNELIKVHNIDNKIRIINSVKDNGLFSIK